MTKNERLAFEYGKTFSPKTESENAPCYDDRMNNISVLSKSVLTAWWSGRAFVGSDLPAWLLKG